METWTAIVFKNRDRIESYLGMPDPSRFGGAFGDAEKTVHIALEIPSEEYRDAIIPDGRGGAMLDPNWSPPVPEPTVEERLTARLEALETKIEKLEEAK